MKTRLFAVLCGLFVSTAWAMDIEGVNVPDTTVVSGKTLQLNGAGVRTKFFFDIYVGALYLPEKSASASEAMAMAGPKQVTMTFLYKEVSREKLVAAWDEGFRLNLGSEALAPLLKRLEQFNSLFATVKAGDFYVFQFLGDGETSVNLNARELGRISGKDFQQALLSVWLGESPADHSLKKAMLGDN